MAQKLVKHAIGAVVLWALLAWLHSVQQLFDCAAIVLIVQQFF